MDRSINYILFIVFFSFTFCFCFPVSWAQISFQIHPFVFSCPVYPSTGESIKPLSTVFVNLPLWSIATLFGHVHCILWSFFIMCTLAILAQHLYGKIKSTQWPETFYLNRKHSLNLSSSQRGRKINSAIVSEMNTSVIYWPIHMINIFPVVDYGNGHCFVWTLHGVGCRYLNIAKLLKFSTSKTYIDVFLSLKKMKYSTYANSVGHCRERPIRFLFHKMKL